ncbi:MAG: homoserine dehydrogenase, partial [Pseudonocardiales bacterium]|nr:homoserine dehydrogenase [Pseudonocardiales bacterium]
MSNRSSAADVLGSDAGKPLKVALLGCGVVGSAVVRLLTDQADDLTARVGVPLELAGIAVRRPNRHTDVPAHLLTTDAEALVTRADIDLVVEVIGG